MIMQQTDGKTCRSCALVCRAFRPPSQASIFAIIDLIPTGDNAKRFCDILTDSPHLPLSRVLGLLGAITFFSLDLKPDFHGYEVPQMLRTAICDLCRRSHLTSLQLSNIDLVDFGEFAQLVASPALTELTLLKIVLPTPTNDIRLNDRLRLITCSFDLMGPTLAIVMAWLLEAESFSRVRVMNLSWHAGTMSHLQKLTQTPLPHLEGLFLHSHDGEYFLCKM
ncbi:hypothetical protein B0H16DRAFT_1885281 [Mycena metata]|uniref:Uncharacterized protein n=1 Tax=Mycena metata TaxID=1033252 RepID=A0AAD7J6K1_9AGAR|nr:hypothetical protein B0H16DRAFT_1885281 [Mycena metata]